MIIPSFTSYHLLHHWCLTPEKLFVERGKGCFTTLHLWGYVWKWQIENPPQAFILSKKSISWTILIVRAIVPGAEAEKPFNSKHENSWILCSGQYSEG